MRIDGIYFNLTINGYGIDISWDLWEDYVAYEAETRDGRVFIREQRRKFWPKKRRLIHYPATHEKRQS
jgi:hypothetical protein